MTLTELLPALGGLDHKEKLQAVQFLVAELANEDQVAPVNALDAKKTLATEDDAVKAGLDFYRSELQQTLEPEHNGDHVAIHIASRDWKVAKGRGHAMRDIRTRHPEGVVVIHKIGPPDMGLVSRILGDRPQ